MMLTAQMAMFCAISPKLPPSSDESAETYLSAEKSMAISVLSSVASTFSVAVKIMVS